MLPLYLLLWFQRLAMVRAAGTEDSGCNLFFCLNVTVSNDIMTFDVTPVFEPFGWVGLGFGGRMLDTHMVVLWYDRDGSPILSQRYGVGHVEPVIETNPQRPVKLIQSVSPVWHKGNFSATTFQIPVNKTDPMPGRIIWAYSLRQPDSDPNADLTGHYVAGTVNMRINKPVLGQTPTIVAPEHGHNTFDVLPRAQKLI
ncbi:hypothetical protein DFH07DRAFT_81363 [Mycena maculata]|uniref:DOMON domain-containing protein n=1 Tax=Mycena maculata TaxID=230809 RepID=A0AAD7IBS1_9AGAR|nr:hypothetical protein DFH07DRAFT_81363 [Mycena maculata]